MAGKIKYCSHLKRIIRLIYKRLSKSNETCWCSSLLIFIPFILCGCLLLITDIFQVRLFKISLTRIPFNEKLSTISTEDFKDFLVKTNGCRIPNMDSFDKSVKDYIFEEHSIICNEAVPPLIESNLTSLYLLETSLSAYNISDINSLNCCYTAFRRETPKDYEKDTQVIWDTQCIIINQTCKISDEFVKATCIYNGSEIYKDFFSFVPIKPETKRSFKKRYPPMNVLILGIDGVSRLNFHRQMPKTAHILQVINAVEFFGYTKVADNTFPNLIPVLTGLNEYELVANCWPSQEDRFDKCHFIWKEFNDEGYTTAFAEDAAWMGLFNFRKMGFLNQPTDYYWGYFNYHSEHHIGNQHELNVYYCVGSRLVHKTLIEYMEKFISTMNANGKPYFGLFWSSSLSHDKINKPRLGDDDYAEFFNKLKTSGVLNNTILIFMSDHGMRFGNILKTFQGHMEERLPFLFISLPQRYRESYYHTYINLRKNSNKLTTPFDLHETLRDLVDPYALTSKVLNARILTHAKKNKRGYSLFEVIPSSRTCNDAQIAMPFCTCQQITKLNKNDSFVVLAANHVVEYINEKLAGYASCATLRLARILNAHLFYLEIPIQEGNSYSDDYSIVFKTVPGNAIFEATVRRYLDEHRDTYIFNITGTVGRINLYGNQSSCITDFHLKFYCYCT
ncbi:hypothetical protein ILUMI_25046 [Ignelater luminosus]|uniref:DUF229 domain containing protein n=1 Tax=Ignelater luminosus TaxID=2038154 RepID=A0A8K0C5C0_IGNLU|nr:hypothetical protein ILUMI_25046 [Ignelater luminosus]